MINNNSLHIGQPPELEVVSADTIMFHEQPDKNISARLIGKIARDGFLKNPPIVGKTAAGQYILLDGANRTSALIQMEIEHVCVQTVNLDDPHLDISAWSHAVEHPIRRQLEQSLEKQGIDYMERPVDDQKSDSLVEILFRDGTGLAVPPCASSADNVSLLHSITRLYLHQGRMDRVSYYNLDDLIRNYQDFSALFIYSEIEKSDLVNIARSREKMPSGLTRILLPKRALHFNMPLEILSSPESLKHKNDWLKNDIAKRIRAKSIRFYREPTFVFDD